MTERLDPRLYFDTPSAWIDAVVSWARSERRVQRVWVFGSRATGVRRLKEISDPIPDIDIAYELSENDSDTAMGMSIAMNHGWREALMAKIDVPLSLEAVHDAHEVVVPAVRQHGVLIYERSQTPTS